MSIGFNGTIQGTAPDNVTLVGNPVAVAGVDNTGKVQSLLVASDGTLQVSSSGGGGVVTQPDQTLLKDTSYQGGNWTVGISAGVAAIGSVTVSNFPGTQPISAASLPLPSGASTAAKQPSLGTAGSASTDVLTVQGIASMTALKTDGSGVTQPVSGSVSISNFPATQPVSGTVTANAGTGTFAISAASLPLPSGAATAANQTNVQGTAGSPSTAVLTVQGVASGTPQPISGTVTANIGTSGSLALDATSTNGTQKTQMVGATGNVAIVDTNGNQQIRKGFAEAVSLTAGSLNADLVPSTDISAYGLFSLQILTIGSGTLTFQGSNDNSTWVSVTAFVSTAFASTALSTTTTTGIYYGACNFKFLRVRLTSYVSGTFTGVIEFYTTTGMFQSMGVGSVTAVQSGVWTMQPGNTPNTSPWLITQIPATSGGTSIAKILAAASTNSTLVIAGAHQLFSYQLSNAAAYFVYLHLYNKATAPTVGTDVPVAVIGVPPGGTVAWHDVDGTPFTLGIGYSITKGSSDTDTTAVALGDLIGILTTK